MLPNHIIDLDEFKIVEKIGEGMFGKVYLVEEIQTKKLFAAKVIKDGYSNSDEQRKLFQEISSLACIKNPAVLLFYGFNLNDFDHNLYPTIITEYMPNGSLGSLIEKKQR